MRTIPTGIRPASILAPIESRSTIVLNKFASTIARSHYYRGKIWTQCWYVAANRYLCSGTDVKQVLMWLTEVLGCVRGEEVDRGRRVSRRARRDTGSRGLDIASSFHNRLWSCRGLACQWRERLVMTIWWRRSSPPPQNSVRHGTCDTPPKNQEIMPHKTKNIKSWIADVRAVSI